MTNGMPLHFGRYKVIEELGRGGFGSVYLAQDMQLERSVALKVLKAELANDPMMLQRFKREARALARLHHPNIVTVYAVETQHEPPFIVMEYVNGYTLQTYLQQEALPLAEALGLLRQMASALDAAHARGMVHRDVKPANVLISREGLIKLTDFGIVKMTQEGDAGLTTVNSMLGTVLYMAPEQADVSRKDEIGPATDIYALGVVAYQMLAGRVPFEGNSQAVLLAHRYDPPPDPRYFNRKIPASVVTVLMQALAKEPTERYPTADAFIRHLEQHVNEIPTAYEAPRPRRSSAPTRLNQPQPTPQITEVLPSQKPQRGKVFLRALTILFGIVILLGLAGGSLYQASLLWEGGATPEPTAIPLAVVQTGNLNLRAGPGTEFPVLGSYAQGTELQVLTKNADQTWLQVQSADGTTGWMSVNFLALDTPIENIILLITATPTIVPITPTESTSSEVTIEPATATAQPPTVTKRATQTTKPATGTAQPATGTAIPPTGTAIPPTATAIPSTGTAIPPTATAIPATATAIPATATAIPATATAIPATATALPPTATAIPPTATTVPPTETPIPPTPTSIPPTATVIAASPAPAFLFKVGNTAPDFTRGCPGYYIFGYVQDNAGNPLSGVRVQAINEFDLAIPATATKVDPPGGYDIPISSSPARWYVQVVDANNSPLSPPAEVINTGTYVEGSEACWHQVDFVRVN